MSNLFGLGRTGLNAAQAGINATGHNIANVNTPGFSRQHVQVSTAGSGVSGGMYVGRGVHVDAVRRIYDGFLTHQFNIATSRASALDTHAAQISHIDNVLADRTVGLAPAINRFFDGVNAVASKPGDAASRAELLGRADSLVTQFNGLDEFFQTQREAVNQQIATTVQQINSYAERVRELNTRIVMARGTSVGHQPPNDLLDQRDQLITELHELADINTVEQEGAIMLTLGNGQVLLAGDTVFALQASMSGVDPHRIVVAQPLPDGGVVELADNAISGGALGGLTAFRSQTLDVVQNELGRLAISLGAAFNRQHVQGADLAGEPGGDFFSLASPVTALANSQNANSAATFTAEFADASKLTLSDYLVSYDGAASQFSVRRLSDGANVYQGATLEDAEFDGLRLSALNGVATDGDTYLLQPTRHGARDFGLALSDPAAIAASAYDASDSTVAGSSNGDNARALARLQTAKVLGGLAGNEPGEGAMSITEAFSQLVNGIGVQTQSLTTAKTAQQSLKAQSHAAQQAVSGVNLNEEYINLDLYVQQFNASARLIEVGANLFDTLLGLRA